MNMESRRRQEQWRQRRCAADAKTRTVPGFCPQAYQKNTVTKGPKTIRAINGDAKTASPTEFAVHYGRTGFPLVAVYDATDGRWFRWLVPVESVDYNTYLPMLTDGVRDRTRPYGGCATQALWDLLARDVTGDLVLYALPRIVFPLRRALDVGSRDWSVVVRALKTLQKFATVGRSDNRVGRALVPFYKQLLPPLRVYMCTAVQEFASDGLSAYPTYDVAALCTDTLSTLQHTGGPSAYKGIKYVVPIYHNVPVSNYHRNNFHVEYV